MGRSEMPCSNPAAGGCLSLQLHRQRGDARQRWLESLEHRVCQGREGGYLGQYLALAVLSAVTALP